MLIFEILVSVETLESEPDEGEDGSDPAQEIHDLIAKALATAGISPGHYRVHDMLSVSPDGPSLLKVYGTGCHPDLTKILEPLRRHVEIVFMPDLVCFLPRIT